MVKEDFLEEEAFHLELGRWEGLIVAGRKCCGPRWMVS